MRSKPRLKEKQGKEARTSKIYAEKHRYSRRDTEIQLHRGRDTETGWGTGHLPASDREAEHNCCGRKINNQKAGCRDEHSVTQGLTCGCLTHPTICRGSTINRHSKPKKCDFEFRFCQKCYKPPQNTKRGFSRREKNRVIYSTQPGIQTAKNIEVTSSANIIHRTLSKVQMSRDRHVGNSIKVQTQPVHAPPTKYIQRTFSKVQMSRDRHVGSSIKVQTQLQIPQSTNITQLTHALHRPSKVQTFLGLRPHEHRITIQTSGKEYIGRDIKYMHTKIDIYSSKYKQAIFKVIDTYRKTNLNTPSPSRRIKSCNLDSSQNSAPPSPTTGKMDSSKTKTCARHVIRKVRIPTKYKGHKVQMSCTRQTSPAKYKFHKVQISCLRHVTCKVRIPTKYKFHKVQISCSCRVTPPTKYKPQVSCFSYVPAPRIAKPHSTVRASLYCKINIQKARLAYRNKHTPYGPYNLPHMVLCTKQGPDNA